MRLDTRHATVWYDPNRPALKTREGDIDDLNVLHCNTWENGTVVYRTNNRAPEKKMPTPKIVYLVMTYECNMQCSYCLQKDLRHRTLPGDPDIFLNKIRKVPWTLQECTEFIFWGGESLLMWDTVQYIVTSLKKENLINPGCTFLVATNGFLLTPEKLDFFLQHNFRICLSHDGPGGQDARGEDCFENPDIVSFIRKACAKPEKLVMAPTFTPGGLIKRSDLHTFYSAKLPGVSFITNGFRPFYVDTHTEKQNPYLDNQLENMWTSFLDLHTIAVSGYGYNFVDLRVLEASFIYQLRSRKMDFSAYYDSMNDISDKSKIRCNLEGDITALYRGDFSPEYVMGNISDMGGLTLPKNNNFFPENPHLSAMCKNCFVLPLCQGVCAFTKRRFIEMDCASRFVLYLPIMVHLLTYLLRSPIAPSDYAPFKHQDVFEQFFEKYREHAWQHTNL